MIFAYIALGGFAGVVVFGVLFILMALKRGSVKLPGIGMGVCFVVVLAMGVLLVLGIGQPKDDPAADGSSGPGEAQESGLPDGEASYTVGEPVSLEDIAVTLMDVSESEGGNYMAPGDGKIFVLCEFEIENNSEKDIEVSSMLSFEAYVDDYATGMSLSALTSSDKPQLDGSIAAGKNMNGVVGYEVDRDWSSIEIRFTPDFWNDNEFLFAYSKPSA